tara:strand:- start:1608 stop:1946 length:339 start_codon:yes stop_codon:yes gene_type:complete
MTHTTTIIADHKGFTAPRVSGDEYFVDFVVDITAYVQNGITINASDLGLGSINLALVTGVEEIGHSARAVITAETGAYESASSFKLILSTGSAQQSGTGNEGSVRLRVYGNL